jgi:hypothetical protein
MGVRHPSLQAMGSFYGLGIPMTFADSVSVAITVPFVSSASTLVGFWPGPHRVNAASGCPTSTM